MHTRCSGIGKKHCNIRESEKKREIETKKRGEGRKGVVVSFALSCAKRRDPGKGGEGRVFAQVPSSRRLALPSSPSAENYFLLLAAGAEGAKKVLYRSERKCGGAEIPPSWYTICRSELTARGRGGFANVIKPTLANLADGMKRDFFFFAMVHNELFFLQR